MRASTMGIISCVNIGPAVAGPAVPAPTPLTTVHLLVTTQIQKLAQSATRESDRSQNGGVAKQNFGAQSAPFPPSAHSPNSGYAAVMLMPSSVASVSVSRSPSGD